MVLCNQEIILEILEVIPLLYLLPLILKGPLSTSKLSVPQKDCPL